MESGGELEVENVGEVGLASERFEVETIDPEEDAEEEDSGVEHRDGEPKQNVQVEGPKRKKSPSSVCVLLHESEMSISHSLVLFSL